MAGFATSARALQLEKQIERRRNIRRLGRLRQQQQQPASPPSPPRPRRKLVRRCVQRERERLAREQSLNDRPERDRLDGDRVEIDPERDGMEIEREREHSDREREELHNVRIRSQMFQQEEQRRARDAMLPILAAAESPSDNPSPTVHTARAVRVSRNLDAIRTVLFGQDRGGRSQPQPGAERSLDLQVNNPTLAVEKDIQRKPVPNQQVHEQVGQQVDRPPTPFPFSQPHLAQAGPNNTAGQPRSSPGQIRRKPVPRPSSHPVVAGPFTPLQHLLGPIPPLPIPPDAEPHENIMDVDQGADIAIQSSLYGTRTLVRVNSTMFREGGYTPTERLDNWLDDVEDHTIQRRSELAADEAYLKAEQNRKASMKGDGTEGAEGRETNGAKHERAEDTCEDMEPPSKKARRSSLFASIKQQVAEKKRDVSTSAASRRMSEFRQSALGLLSRAGAQTPALLTAAVGQPNANPLPLPTECFRFAFVRDSMAGKTALVERFVKGEFSDRYHEASLSTIHTVLDLKEFRADVELWDIADSAQKMQSYPLVMTYFHAVFICYSIENDKNPQAVVNMWQHVVRKFCENVPIFVLGLKKDLRPQAPTLKLHFLNEPNVASKSQGEFAGMQIGAAGFTEVSAKTGEGVNELFEHVVHHAMAIRKVQNQKRAERVRRDRIRNVVSATAKTAAQLFCFAPNL